jgi:hypothetical protein
VTEHLKPWHKFCDDNYLLDWKSVYDVKPEHKWMRTCSEDTDLPLPSWVNLLNDPIGRKVQVGAQNSLADALEKYRRRKGRGKCEVESSGRCWVDQCFTSQETYTSDEFLNHLRDLHHYPDDQLTQIKRCLEGEDKIEKEEMQHEELDRTGRDVRHKRYFVEEEDSSSECIPGPSKRVRVA